MSNGEVTFTAAIDRKLFLEDRQKFFREVYERPVPRVRLPASRFGFGWGGIMAEFMTAQWLFDCACASTNTRVGPGARKYSLESLDTLIAHNDRDPKNGAYAYWCRDTEEADKENANKSRDQIVAAGIQGMTVAEYIDSFLWFHWKTGKLLDRHNRAHLTGSRYRDGGVPRGDAAGGLLRVHWNYPGSGHGLLRSREVAVAL